MTYCLMVAVVGDASELSRTVKVGTLKRIVREEQEDKKASVPLYWISKLVYSIVSLVFLVEKQEPSTHPISIVRYS